MKRWLILAALVVAISGMASVAVRYLPAAGSSGDEQPYPVNSKPDGPVAVVFIKDPPKYEFGAKAQHDKFEKDWTIWNKGQADLILDKPHPTCSCTVADFPGEVDKIIVKPNDSTTLHMTFETRDFDGEYYKHAEIPTNDPVRPRLELGAHGTVKPCLVLFPPDRTIGFATLPNDTPHSSKFALSSPDQPDFKITKISSSKPGVIEAKFTDLSDDDKKQLKMDKGYRIEVTINPGMPLGPFRDELLIETDHPKQHEMRLTLHGKVVGPVAVIPEHLILTGINGRLGGKGEVLVLARAQRPTKVEVVKKPAQLQVAVEPTDVEGKYRLIVSVPPGTAAAEIEDVIELKTDHPLAAVVKVPVTIYIRDEAPVSAARLIWPYPIERRAL